MSVSEDRKKEEDVRPAEALARAFTIEKTKAKPKSTPSPQPSE